MIEKITDHNLERYDSRLKEWCDRKFFEKGNYGKYQTTEEAGAVSFYPAPDTPLEGKVKFSFKETPPAEGDKGLSNPSTISGVSTINVYHAGKNLMPPNTVWRTYSWGDELNGITATKISDAVINIDGTCSGDTYINLVPFINIPVGTTCTLSGVKADASNTTYRIVCFNAASDVPKDFGSGATWVQESFSYGVMPSINTRTNYKAENLELKIQIELGATKTEFEAPVLTTYTIPLGSTYYGGEIDLSTGVMTVKSQKVMIDGSCIYTFLAGETNENRVAVVAGIPDILSSNEFKLLRSTSSCDRLPLIPYQSMTNSDECIMFGAEWQIVRYKQIRIYMLRSTLGVSSSATATEVQEAAKTWFSSHPATFITGYEESYWTTVQLNPVILAALAQTDKYTPRLNTVYTDADSIQISYLKSPIRDEYEKTQAILSLGGNS